MHFEHEGNIRYCHCYKGLNFNLLSQIKNLSLSVPLFSMKIKQIVHEAKKIIMLKYSSG